MVSKRNLLLQGSIFRFHVSFPGSKCFSVEHVGGKQWKKHSKHVEPNFNFSAQDHSTSSVHWCPRSIQIPNIFPVILHAEINNAEGSIQRTAQFIGEHLRTTYVLLRKNICKTLAQKNVANTPTTFQGPMISWRLIPNMTIDNHHVHLETVSFSICHVGSLGCINALCVSQAPDKSASPQKEPASQSKMRINGLLRRRKHRSVAWGKGMGMLFVLYKKMQDPTNYIYIYIYLYIKNIYIYLFFVM